MVRLQASSFKPEPEALKRGLRASASGLHSRRRPQPPRSAASFDSDSVQVFRFLLSMFSHSCLFNLDILHEIFLNLRLPQKGEVSPDDMKGMRALAHCAVVCRTFHEPAARNLWSRLLSPLTLLQFFELTISSWDHNNAGEEYNLHVSVIKATLI